MASTAAGTEAEELLWKKEGATGEGLERTLGLMVSAILDEEERTWLIIMGPLSRYMKLPGGMSCDIRKKWISSQSHAS